MDKTVPGATSSKPERAETLEASPLPPYSVAAKSGLETTGGHRVDDHVTWGAGWLNSLADQMIRDRLATNAVELGVSLDRFLRALLQMYTHDVLTPELELMNCCTKRP